MLLVRQLAARGGSCVRSCALTSKLHLSPNITHSMNRALFGRLAFRSSLARHIQQVRFISPSATLHHARRGRRPIASPFEAQENTKPKVTSHKDRIEGQVDRVIFRSRETGYTICRLTSGDSVVGTVADPNSLVKGVHLKASGSWKTHPKFGMQFDAKSLEVSQPSSDTALVNYLASGIIPGVGPKIARQIVDKFGQDTLDILESSPSSLLEVSGIGASRIDAIQEAWRKHKHLKDIMLFLHEHGIPSSMAMEMEQQYGDDTIEVISTNPYRLAADIAGIGFKTVDRIAAKLKLGVDSEMRIEAGIVHCIQTAIEKGHCFVNEAELNKSVVDLLSTPSFKLETPVFLERCKALVEQGTIVADTLTVTRDVPNGEPVVEDRCVFYHPALHYMEKTLGGLVNDLLDPRRSAMRKLNSNKNISEKSVNEWLDSFAAVHDVSFSYEQRQAVVIAATEGIVIITGGPGCGKTFTLKAVVACWQHFGIQPLLTSPTGRGAYKLSEMTSHPASTIHRALEYDHKIRAFRRNHKFPLSQMGVVVDEASMIDLPLCYSLVKALSPSAQLVMVGDADQLPSVGPGNILHDLIESGVVPVVRLTKVFRQALASKIVTNAHMINDGKFPHLEKAVVSSDGVMQAPKSDCMWIECEDNMSEAYLEDVLRSVIQNVVPASGLSSDAVQIISPMIRGTCGTNSLNRIMQRIVNPRSNSAHASMAGDGGPRSFAPGDRVIQLKNNYDKEVYNGDLGIVKYVNESEHTIDVEFFNSSVSGSPTETAAASKRVVTYTKGDFSQLTLAWGITVHKSQGSEFDVTIIPVSMQHYILLSRHLLYTAVTRAKSLAIILGSKRALGYAVRHVSDSTKNRNSHLNHRVLGLEDEEIEAPLSEASTITGEEGHVSESPPIRTLPPAAPVATFNAAELFGSVGKDRSGSKPE